MGKALLERVVAAFVALFIMHSNIYAQDSAQNQERLAAKQELINAKDAVQEATQMAEQIILEAQAEAERIRLNSQSIGMMTDLTPIEIQSSRIAVEISAGTVQEIATAIMPNVWRILVDVKEHDVLQRRFQFVSTKSRDQALRDLLTPIGLRHQYFFDLMDENGIESPLLVISKR